MYRWRHLKTVVLHSCYLIVWSFRLLKACACFTSSRYVLSPPHVRSSAEDRFARSSLHLSAKRETPWHFILSAPQTNRVHISTLFWTLDKGISGILEFFLRLRWRSLLTLPSCIQPFLDEPVMVLVPISLYVLELYPWWVCYSDAHVYELILCTLLICFYFCGQLAWCKNKDLYSWYLHTFSLARLLWGQKKACLTRWREHKTKKKKYRNRLI